MNVFEKAKASTVKATAKPKPRKEKAEISISGLEDYSAVCAVLKSLEALKKTMEVGVKAQCLDNFIDTGMEIKRRPENFKGVEGAAEASCELRLRSSASVLAQEEIDLLAEHNIPVRVDDVVVETFIINPAYAQNPDMLKKVSKALAAVKDLPEDFIQHQSQTKTCADETSIDAVYRLADRDTVATLLPLVTTLATKPKICGEGADKTAFDIVGKLLKGDEAEAA